MKYSWCEVPILFLSLCCILTDVVASSDVAASSASIQQLIVNEEQLIDALDDTIKEEEEKIKNLKKLRDEMSQSYEELKENGVGDMEKYIGNPINAYNVIKRYSTDWRHVREAVNNPCVKGRLACMLALAYM